jgi:hypothetical protein
LSIIASSGNFWADQSYWQVRNQERKRPKWSWEITSYVFFSCLWKQPTKRNVTRNKNTIKLTESCVICRFIVLDS